MTFSYTGLQPRKMMRIKQRGKSSVKNARKRNERRNATKTMAKENGKPSKAAWLFPPRSQRCSLRMQRLILVRC